ncbi:MAG: hypothetical protein RL885_11130 [Planctomycetota bacterium]
MNSACETVRAQFLEMRRIGLSAEYEQHLASCGDCADACRRIESVARILGRLDKAEAPVDLWEGIEARLDASELAERRDSFTMSLRSLPRVEAPADLWDRVQAGIQEREESVWRLRPGSVRLERSLRLLRAAAILVPLVLGSYLIWSPSKTSSPKRTIVWSDTAIVRTGDPADPLEKIAFSLGEGSWVAER